MKIIEVNSLQDVFNKNDKLAIMLGDFDGMHKGHKALLKTLLSINLKHALLTFYPHPLEILLNKEFKYLDLVSDKIELLDNCLDYLIIINTSKDILNSSKIDFINFLKNNYITDVVCGKDFSFGKNKEGSVNDLNVFNCHIIDDVMNENVRISSSLIRNLIKEGNVEKANFLLGRDYFIKGVVTKGNMLGRTINFPTANISYSKYLMPARGVYFGYAVIDNNKYYGMINIGINPTFNLLKENRLEINIFDFSNNLYDKEIKVCFIKKIREEKKFNSKEELVNELIKNKDECFKLAKEIKN